MTYTNTEEDEKIKRYEAFRLSFYITASLGVVGMGGLWLSRQSAAREREASREPPVTSLYALPLDLHKGDTFSAFNFSDHQHCSSVWQCILKFIIWGCLSYALVVLPLFMSMNPDLEDHKHEDKDLGILYGCVAAAGILSVFVGAWVFKSKVLDWEEWAAFVLFCGIIYTILIVLCIIKYEI